MSLPNIGLPWGELVACGLPRRKDRINLGSLTGVCPRMLIRNLGTQKGQACL